MSSNAASNQGYARHSTSTTGPPHESRSSGWRPPLVVGGEIVCMEHLDRQNQAPVGDPPRIASLRHHHTGTRVPWMSLPAI